MPHVLRQRFCSPPFQPPPSTPCRQGTRGAAKPGGWLSACHRGPPEHLVRRHGA